MTRHTKQVRPHVVESILARVPVVGRAVHPVVATRTPSRLSFDPAVAPAEMGAGVPDESAVFQDFLAALGDGPTTAAACFAAEGVFSRAAYVAGCPRILATGPEAIAAVLADRRPGPPRPRSGRSGASGSLDAEGRLLRDHSVGLSRHS